MNESHVIILNSSLELLIFIFGIFDVDAFVLRFKAIFIPNNIIYKLGVFWQFNQ